MNFNQTLRSLGFVNGRDYLLTDDGSGVSMRWISAAAQPSGAELAAAWAALRAKAYRLRRKAAYIARLGEDANFENTVGDVLDAVIRQVELNRVAAGAAADPEFAAIVDEIAAIKAEFPKGGA